LVTEQAPPAEPAVMQQFLTMTASRAPAPPATRVLGRLEKCMYCGSTAPRSREHIIPRSLNGELVLDEASCSKCSGITTSFERKLAKGTFAAARARYEFQSYRPRARPKALPLTLVFDDGSERVVDIDAPRFPIALCFPVYGPPTYLADAPSELAGLRHNLEIQISDISEMAAIVQRFGAAGGHVPTPVPQLSFARLIAKVGYGLAIADPDVSLRETFVLPLILGASSDFNRYVGNLDEAAPPRTAGLHSVTTQIVGDHAVAFVRLFSGFGAPEYVVIIGRVA
jgi:HNH endonuclease